MTRITKQKGPYTRIDCDRFILHIEERSTNEELFLKVEPKSPTTGRGLDGYGATLHYQWPTR
jgi:hypothetical protein